MGAKNTKQNKKNFKNALCCVKIFNL